VNAIVSLVGLKDAVAVLVYKERFESGQPRLPYKQAETARKPTKMLAAHGVQ
jgi:hypothetical protein